MGRSLIFHSGKYSSEPSQLYKVAEENISFIQLLYSTNEEYSGEETIIRGRFLQ
jgi:hypothetical protein